MGHNASDVAKTGTGRVNEWHTRIYADGDASDFLNEISADLVEEFGVTVTEPSFVIFDYYTVVFVSSPDQDKVDAACRSLVAKGAIFKRDFDDLGYMYFTTGEYGDLF